MKRLAVVAGLALALFGAIGARAGTATAADAVAQLYCADADGSKHPKKLTVMVPVLIDDFENFDEGRLLASYDPEGRPGSFKGKLTARVTLHRPDGSKTSLGKLSSRQNTANGAILSEKLASVSFREGDVLEWRIAFKKFDPLNQGDCFALLAGVQPPAEDCGPYPDWSTSEYVLPYQPGTTLIVSQGNCSVGSHRGAARHAYDIAMPLGTEIVAARGGEVIAVDDSAPDGTGLFSDDNSVVIRQADGTLASYVHIQQGGALVSVGDTVARGTVIALSGNSGHTSGLPHLHFQVTTCANRNECGTEPITFRNTEPNPGGLIVGASYRAEN